VAGACAINIRFARVITILFWGGHRVVSDATMIVENDSVQRINMGAKYRRMGRPSTSPDIPAFPGLIDADTHVQYS
jgi:hypothetical protein